MANTLKETHQELVDQIEDWSRRRGQPIKAPFPSDSPCYYCGYSDEPHPMCNWCIQNPEAEVWHILIFMEEKGEIWL